MSTIEKTKTPEYSDVDLDLAKQTAETLAGAVKRSIHPLENETVQYPEIETTAILPSESPLVGEDGWNLKDAPRRYTLSRASTDIENQLLNRNPAELDENIRDRAEVSERETQRDAFRKRELIEQEEKRREAKGKLYEHPEHIDPGYDTRYDKRAMKIRLEAEVLAKLPPEEAANYLRVERMYKEALEELMLEKTIATGGAYHPKGYYDHEAVPSDILVPEDHDIANGVSSTGESYATYRTNIRNSRKPDVTRIDLNPKNRPGQVYYHTYKDPEKASKTIQGMSFAQERAYREAKAKQNVDNAKNALEQLRGTDTLPAL
ncbi:MAG: hypothetical protein H6799_01095 [Candidatus Nomurabacteria bacterium]|nr:MAG: hypothetical protein H6799_01095 [Candidatus Nomurabacteria bacterium]HRV76227.1 hypothetical protein [Candidatus Saccharimonadales bacterium]